MTARALCLALLTASSVSSAQNISGEEYVNFSNRPNGYSLLRATVSRTTRGYAGDLVVRTVTAWPYSETRTKMALRMAAMSSRSVWLPVALWPGDEITVSLDRESGGHAFSASQASSPSHGSESTFMAVAGLGERVVYDATQFASGTDLIAGAVRAGSDPGDVSLPTVPSAWGGVHVVLAGAEALMRASPEGRRALAQWVSLGGILAISPRTTGDLRDPWIASLMGPVEETPAGRWTYDAQSQENPESLAIRPSGLGSVVVLPMDLSVATWNSNRISNSVFRSFVGSLAGAGGAMVAPGDLGLFRKTLENNDPQSVLRPYVILRPVLLPIAAMLTLYIVAVGLLLGRRSARKEPMKRLMQLPVMSLGVLGMVVFVSHFTRSGASTARVIALYDMAGGSQVALRRVMAGLTAGASQTFDLTSPEGTLGLFRAGSSAAHGTLRWDGAGVSIERARLGLFETGMYYAEGVVNAGQGMSLTEGEDASLSLVNRTPWTVLEARYDDGSRRVIWEFGGAAPGGSTRASGSHAFRAGTACDRLWGAGRWAPRYGSRGQRADMHRVVFDQMLADPPAGHHDGYLWALVALPEEVRRLMPGFRVERSMALVRVVLPRPGPRGLSRSRLGTRNYYNDANGPASELSPAAPAAPSDGGLVE